MIRSSGSIDRPEGSVSVENLEFHVMISRSRSPLVSTVASERASEPIPAKNRERSRGGLRGASLGRKDGYDRKSLPRRNWLYKIGSAPGSYSCLLRMQTSSPNACKPHGVASFPARPQREDLTVSTDTRPCSRFPPRYPPVSLVLADPRVQLPVVSEETPEDREKFGDSRNLS